MAKDRDRALNPAAAQRKADKAKALKKGKAAVAAQRTERLSRQNPERLQRQIDDLKALEASSGSLSARDQKTLSELERDVLRVRKAKEAVGDKGQPTRRPHEDRGSAPRGRGGARGGSVLGKRKWDTHEGDSDGSATDDSVRRIPMPRDTPPPVPRPRVQHAPSRTPLGGGSSANAIPLGQGRGGGERQPHALPEKPVVQAVQAQTVYEAKPAVRDLRKEAVRAFVPSVVRRKMEATKGVGGRLLEEEEVEGLEREGYAVGGGKVRAVGVEGGGAWGLERQEVGGGGEEGVNRALLQEEEERFERELRGVQMEEVMDEDG